MTKDILAIPDFGNNGMIQSVPSDPLLRSLTVIENAKISSEEERPAKQQKTTTTTDP